MVQCSVLGCKNRPGQGLCDITFHRFPSNEYHLKLWTQVCGRNDWRPTKHARICSKHFNSKCLTHRGNKTFLKPNSLPTKDICVFNDIDHYLKHKWVGGRAKLKNGVIPHKFECQNQMQQKAKNSAAHKKSQIKRKKLTRRLLHKENTPLVTRTPNKEAVACLYDKDVLDPLSSEISEPYLEISKDNQTKDKIDNLKEENSPQEFEGNDVVDYPETNKFQYSTHKQEMTHIRSQEDKMIEAAHDVSSIKEENISECRACLQKIYTDSTFYNIFDCWEQQEGMDTTIAENLSSVANIQISESDLFPKVICDVCCSLLQSAYAFAVNVRKTDHILRYRIENAEHQGISEKTWPKPIQIDRNVENAIYNADMEVKKEVLSEEECTNEITQEQDFAELDIKIEPEELSQHIPDKLLVNGTHALEDSKSELKHILTNGNGDLEKQTHTAVKEEPVSDEDSESTTTDLSLECMLCTKIFNSVTGLKAHVIAQHSYKGVKRKHGSTVSPKKNTRRYTCTTCGRYFSTSTDLMVHETCHNKSVCYRCNESFDTFPQLIEHRKKCKAVSNKEVSRLKTLEDAKRPKSLETQCENPCTTCDTSFSSLAHLRQHQKESHSNNEYLNSNSFSDNEDSQRTWSPDSMSDSSS